MHSRKYDFPFTLANMDPADCIQDLTIRMGHDIRQPEHLQVQENASGHIRDTYLRVCSLGL